MKNWYNFCMDIIIRDDQGFLYIEFIFVLPPPPQENWNSVYAY